MQPLVAYRHLAQQHQSLIVHALRDLGLVEAEFGQQPEAGEVRDRRGTVLPMEHLLRISKNFAIRI